MTDSEPDSDLDGQYTLKENGEKKEDICIDGCVYTKTKDGDVLEGEYCFITAPPSKGSNVVCEVSSVNGQ